MTKLPDIPMPGTVENEVKDYFYYIRLYWNNGRYQITKYTTAPTTSTSGQEGEARIVTSGNNGYLYWFDNTDWFYVQGTKVT